ncbi:MAG TPA: proline dehydrogenase family protein, partial [Burkholderiaceae bacterium]
MPTSARLPSPYRDEAPIVDALLQSLAGRLDWPSVVATAAPWVQAVRDKPAPFWALESLLREYPISSAEGLALMRLAEALLRVPDAETAIALTADQLGRADFSGGDDGDSPHRLLATLSSSAIVLAKRWLPGVGEPPGLLERLGSRTVVAATVRAIQLLGRQFVLGRHIGEALEEARAQRRDAPTLRFSFDMLGEGARTERDALRYLAAYDGAIRAIAAQVPQGSDATPGQRDGISIKLSALHSRYEDAQRERVMGELMPRLAPLLDLAAAADINLTIDAEESDRLELSLDVFDALAAHVQQHAPRWSGFGLAVQAYQTRVIEVIDEVARIARARRLRFMVRLVKGAYWDGEIKRAQEGGFDGYPVFTHKQHTDIAYLAGARALIAHHDAILPQFATHNAGTIAAILQMARAQGAAYEMQRLHGMGEGVYREVMASWPELSLRVYAPVGEHRDLLAYLVRRLLENGANSSFVHQLSDAGVPVAELLASPLQRLPGTGQPLPRNLYGPSRINPHGVDLTCVEQREPLLAAWSQVTLPAVREADAAAADTAMQRLRAAFPAWNARPVQQRAHILELAAERLEA